MVTVIEEVLDSFFESLEGSDKITEAQVKALREFFSSEESPKADDLVEILSSAEEDLPA